MINHYERDVECASFNSDQDIKDKAATLLDSSTASVSAPGATLEPRQDEGDIIISTPDCTDWYYLMLRSKDLHLFSELLSGKTPLHIRENNAPRSYTFRFKTFIYTTADHLRRLTDCPYTEAEYEKRKIAARNVLLGIDGAGDVDVAMQEMQSRGGGYLFVCAPFEQLSAALQLITPRRYPILDRATSQPARIPARQMKKFIMIYEAAPWSVQFASRPIQDYAKNHELIRITGGSLRGAEGYIVRIHKDRKLIFSFGNMTLAVSGIHSFPFEPASKLKTDLQ